MKLENEQQLISSLSKTYYPEFHQPLARLLVEYNLKKLIYEDISISQIVDNIHRELTPERYAKWTCYSGMQPMGYVDSRDSNFAYLKILLHFSNHTPITMDGKYLKSTIVISHKPWIIQGVRYNDHSLHIQAFANA